MLEHGFPTKPAHRNKVLYQLPILVDRLHLLAVLELDLLVLLLNVIHEEERVLDFLPVPFVSIIRIFVVITRTTCLAGLDSLPLRRKHTDGRDILTRVQLDDGDAHRQPDVLSLLVKVHEKALRL